MSLVLDSGSTSRLHCPVCASGHTTIQRVEVNPVMPGRNQAKMTVDPVSGAPRAVAIDSKKDSTPGITLLLACENDHDSALRFGFSALDMATTVENTHPDD